MKRQQSVKKNMIINAIRSIMNIAFPLITFPYASRVLGVEGLGRFDFANSIMCYFVLVASLGFEKYAIREGASIRSDKEKINRFGDQIFTLNLYSTIIVYFTFFVVMFTSTSLLFLRPLLFVLSLEMSLKVFGVEWVYSIYEDYLFLTIRTISFQLLAILFLFIFVRSPGDLLMYCLFHVLSSSGVYVVNWFYAKKHIRLKLVKNVDLKQHIKPILILFAMEATITIYVVSDKTMLGFLCGEFIVGIYAVSTKLYSIAKAILSAVIIVAIPRLSFLYSSDKDLFNTLASEVYKMLLAFLIPAVVGMIMLRKEIILLISNDNYIKSTESFLVLCVALVFCMLAWFWGQCILVPEKKEIEVFKATVISAILNIILNLIFIPLYNEIAAAVTTLLSQAVAFFWCWVMARRTVCFNGIHKVLIKTLIGCLGIVICYYYLSSFNLSLMCFTLLTILLSFCIYIIVEVVLKNEAIIDNINWLLTRN